MDINNGLVIQYGHVAGIPNNSGKTITTPIPMTNYAHYIATPIWTNTYVNHVACYWVNSTTLGFFNYRSSSNQSNSINIMWACFV